MSRAPYLQRLTGRLIDGVDRLSPDFRGFHASWIQARQNPDGGFSGREGPSDLYYTGFALRSLAVLQSLQESTCEAAAGFLRSSPDRYKSVVDLFSFLVGGFLIQIGGGPDVLTAEGNDWTAKALDFLESHRHADGGYSKSPGGTSGSTYTTFLAAMTYEMLGKPIPEPQRVVQFVRSRHRNGGFAEIAAMRRAGTNPTAAGVGTLRILDALDEKTSQTVGEFLLPLFADEEGGMRANDRIPAADLLSTFTGCWTLDETAQFGPVDRGRVHNYAKSLQGILGGFRGGSWDVGLDVEYTFYGIGLLGLLASQTQE